MYSFLFPLCVCETCRLSCNKPSFNTVVLRCNANLHLLLSDVQLRSQSLIFVRQFALKHCFYHFHLRLLLQLHTFITVTTLAMLHCLVPCYYKTAVTLNSHF